MFQEGVFKKEDFKLHLQRAKIGFHYDLKISGRNLL